ncbi:acetylornithine deacetylase [Sulfitobacter sp. BDSS02]|nr:acetylornithine deacetylase [Sulfitobacter sp. BDSS02]MBR9849549.1 acetylornithine deacetylase [Paracoccaceae bacterium]
MNSKDILDHLIGFPTISAESNLDLIGWVERYLRDLGFSLWRIEDPTGKKAGLFARIGPDLPDGIMLSAHSDVVPVSGQDWSYEQFRLRESGGRLYGRGTADMKGFLASMLRAAAAASKARLKEPLKLVISYDEEVGCKGIAEMMPVLVPLMERPRLCIVGEPTSMQIATGHKGKASYRATCTGEAGHSAMAPRYRNALHLGADFIGALRALQMDLSASGAQDTGYDVPYSTVHAGCMAGGTALNIIPDLCHIDYEIRHLAADPLASLEARLEEAADWIGDVTIEKTGAYPGLEVALNSTEVQFLRALLPAPKLTKVGFGTEAGHFHSAGIPTLVCGPGNMDQGHKADEFIEISELEACDRMMDHLVEELAG